MALLVLLALIPAFAGEYVQLVVTEILILALFAASLHFIMGIGGLVSFGHAAWFGLGAYAAALLFTQIGGADGRRAGGGTCWWRPLTALVFGWFCIRLTGVYLAMLTLAFAQILWSVALQSTWTGGDNGILGVWPSALARLQGRLLLSDAGAVRGRPAGVAARGVRALRLCAALQRATPHCVPRPSASTCAASSGWPSRWPAPVAGLAGALHAFHKGSVFPTVLSIPQSIDALVMVLLGGLQTLSGPAVGAAAYHFLQTEIMRATEYWRVILGGVILLLVIAFPQGS